SYFGGLYMVKACYYFISRWKWFFFASVVFIPSVALWSSGVLKEGIFMGAFGIFLYSFFSLYRKQGGWKVWSGLAVSVFILLVIKVYLLLCLIPGVLYILSGRIFYKEKPFRRYLIVQALILLL